MVRKTRFQMLGKEAGHLFSLILVRNYVKRKTSPLDCFFTPLYSKIRRFKRRYAPLKNFNDSVSLGVCSILNMLEKSIKDLHAQCAVFEGYFVRTLVETYLSESKRRFALLLSSFLFPSAFNYYVKERRKAETELSEEVSSCLSLMRLEEKRLDQKISKIKEECASFQTLCSSFDSDFFYLYLDSIKQIISERREIFENVLESVAESYA